MYKAIVDKVGGYLFFVFRVLVGFLFFQHGAQKLLGWFGGIPMNAMMYAAGFIELAGGILIIFGLFTRLTATVTALEMLAAYFIAHAPSGWNPFQFGGNGGELALLYFASFLVMIIYGAGRFSVEQALWKKELF